MNFTPPPFHESSRDTTDSGGARIASDEITRQNFLHDGNQLRRIVEAADLKSTDQVLEIGPGLGPLTELLLNHAASDPIEKDRRWPRF